MKTVILGVVITATLAAPAAAQEQPARKEAEPTRFSRWMDVKVEEAQKIFASLARADFKSIVASTEKLKAIGALEGFVRRGVPGYRTQLRSFEFAVAEIQLQAERENIEGVTMGFNQLTLSCVNCHKQLRRATVETPAANAVETPGSEH
jgi:hypothetical protein